MQVHGIRARIRAMVLALTSMGAFAGITGGWVGAARAETGPIADPTIFGRYRALLIANQRYQHVEPLSTPAADVGALRRLLESRYGFDVQTLLDATRDQMLDALQAYRESLEEDDRFLLYYAGHGVIDQDTKKGYWLPIDAVADKKSRWLSTGDVTNELQAMRARHVLVIADSCYSAAMVRDLGLVRRPTSELEKLVARKARRALTAGGRAPVLDTGSGNHSVFAGALLRTLEDNQDVALAWDIYNRLAPSVRTNTGGEQKPEYNVIPSIGDEEGDFVFVPRGRAASTRPAARPNQSSTPEPRIAAVPAPPAPPPPATAVLELVTNDQFAAFQRDRGYVRQELWDPDGWAWRQRFGVSGPQFVNNRNATQPTAPVVGVSWYEASAYARWRGGRLPSLEESATACKQSAFRVGAWTRDAHPQYPDKYHSLAAGCVRDYGPPDQRRLDVGIAIFAPAP